MNDTQSTTNNSLRDPNNNGIAAPMDIDQDDDTDDEDQCMSNDIPIEQQNRWAAYENEPWYQKVKQKEAAKQAKKTSKTPISETDNKLEILLRRVIPEIHLIFVSQGRSSMYLAQLTLATNENNAILSPSGNLEWKNVSLGL
eukprot:788718_1